MPALTTLYDSRVKALLAAAVKIDGIKVALISSAYTFNAAHTSFTDDVEADEISGTNYVAGGAAVTNITLSDTALDFDDAVFTNVTFTARYAVFYIPTTIDGVAKPVLCAVLLDDTPADINVTGSNFSISIPAAGFDTYTQSVV
jgi:hypothetical protein